MQYLYKLGMGILGNKLGKVRERGSMINIIESLLFGFTFLVGRSLSNVCNYHLLLLFSRLLSSKLHLLPLIFLFYLLMLSKAMLI